METLLRAIIDAMFPVQDGEQPLEAPSRMPEPSTTITRAICSLHFANDIDLTADTDRELQDFVHFNHENEVG